MKRNKEISGKAIRVLTESVAAVLILKFFVFSPFIVSGESMNDSLRENEIFFAVKRPALSIVTLFDGRRMNHFIEDRVVVIERGGELLAKRCVGTEGDTLIFSAEGMADTFIVPKDSIFVMGDNFRNSNDSRSFGFVAQKNLVGVGLFKERKPL